MPSVTAALRTGWPVSSTTLPRRLNAFFSDTTSRIGPSPGKAVTASAVAAVSVRAHAWMEASGGMPLSVNLPFRSETDASPQSKPLVKPLMSAPATGLPDSSTTMPSTVRARVKRMAGNVVSLPTSACNEGPDLAYGSGTPLAHTETSPGTTRAE